MGSPHWPLFDLVVRTPRVELRYPDDALLDQLATASMSDIHPPEEMPFGEPWTDTVGADRGRGSVQWGWRARADWKPGDWHAGFAVVCDSEVVGSQSMLAKNFAACRTVSTGSWLTMERQGQGIGKEMRAAVVHLAFAGLGATRCESGAFEDNPRSLGVSRALGYVENGDEMHTRRDGAARIVRLLLDRSSWIRRDDITIEGLEPCLGLFGVEG